MATAEWYARVKKLVLSCKFGNNLDAFILNQFVMGLPDKIFEQMCKEDERLTVGEALRKAMIFETKLAAKSGEGGVSTVNYIKQRGSKGESRNNKNFRQNNNRGSNNKRNKEKKRNTAFGNFTHPMNADTKTAHATFCSVSMDSNVSKMYSLSVAIDGLRLKQCVTLARRCLSW